MDNVYECTICDGEFDLDSEGGTVGDFGILPVAFCPTCLACCVDMAQQMADSEEEGVQ
jgi:hypothetical protein